MSQITGNQNQTSKPEGDATGTSKEQQILENTKTHYEAWNKTDADLMKTVTVEKIARHANGKLTTADQAGLAATFNFFKTAVPDFTLTPSDIIIKGDKSFTKWVVKGHKYRYVWRQSTNRKKMETHGLTILSFNDEGKVTQEEAYYDQLSFLERMMVIQNGKVIFSYGDLKELSYIASGRKSVLSILYGPFVENGKINLNTTLEQLNITDVKGLLPIEKKATIQDLLTSRSGVYHEPGYWGDEYAFAPKRGSVKPGSFFLYNNWDFNLAGYLFEKLSGVGIYEAVDSMLARPLNMEDWDKKIQRKDADTLKSIYPAYPMLFSTRDMARIGYLMLRNGQWEGKQITPKNWVQTITTSVTSVKEMSAFKSPYYKDGAYLRYFGYGYMWWVWDAPGNKGVYKGAYTAQGNFGQYITVLPALDLVIAHKTKAAYERYTSNYLTILTKLIDANNSKLSIKNK